MGKKIQCIGRYVMDSLTLGKGNFARVELATHGVTGCKVAIKIIDTRKIKEDYTKVNLHREARILGQIRHPNIVRLYETLKATTLYCLVLEYASGGDLLAFIKSQKENRLQENKARPYFRQLISAIHFLHERGVAHRDLKMENILLDEKRKNLKVIDFGLSNTYSRGELMKTHCGSLEYAAPELIASNDKYGPEVDLWSLGIILYGMVIGKLPFSTHYTDQYRRQKLLAQIEKGLTESHNKEMALNAISPGRDNRNLVLYCRWAWRFMESLRSVETDPKSGRLVSGRTKIALLKLKELFATDTRYTTRDLARIIDLSELLKKLIEPSPERRLPLIDCETHPWVTNSGKLPFCPFQSLPKDKTAKSQDIEYDTDTDEVIDELTALLETPREQVEKTVHESKCDDFSAMFNMMLDCKRMEKGMFDVDFTVKQETKKDRHHRKKHHQRASSSKTEQHRVKHRLNNNNARILENAKSNHISKDQSIHHNNDILPESPDIYNIPLCFWEEFVKATPAILCPDIEAASDHEGEPKMVHHSHNSTNFDLMALCSAPTWLGGDRRKSRRRRSPLPPPSPLVAAEGTVKTDLEASAAGGGHDHTNLLSPTQASSQVSALLRRNSSRRRTRRTSSADPPSRNGSTNSRRLRRHRPGTPGSGPGSGPGSDPHSPHSPSNLNNPEIKIITPKQSPVTVVKRPANLVGLKECYTNSNSKGLSRKSTLGPGSTFSRRRKHKESKDQTDCAESTHSDSSNPCSTTNLHEDFSDGSQEMLSQPESRPDSRASCTSYENAREESVESKIAAADIRSIVRPKQFILKGKVNGTIKNGKSENVCTSLQVPNLEDTGSRNMPASPEIIIESMQPNSYANLSDDEKLERQMSCEIPKTDSEKRVGQEKTDLLIPHVVSSSDNLHSSTELLGAACLKPAPENDELVNSTNNNRVSESFDDVCKVKFYANTDDMDDNVNQPCATEKIDHYSVANQPKRLIADLYSKKEKISLEDRILMQDDICFLDSSDHNSSQENLFSNNRRRRLKESLTSDENESMSAPILLSPRELGLKLSHGDGYGESPIRPRVSSAVSSRHGSTPSVRFVMPSTPIRQMFKTPIARIDSFHSDDFEAYTSDVDALVASPSPSPSPNSITPTVPCFQYKLHSRRKKNLLRKSSKNRRKLNKDGMQYARDGIMSFLPEKPTRVEVRTNDALFSSSSECGSDGQVPDGEKAMNASKAKIFPMEKDEDQSDMKANRLTSHMNDKTKMISEIPVNQNSSKKLQNSICKTFLSKQQSQDAEPKKSSWRRGFAHLLKKKKFSSVNGGNNNNDVDSPSRNRTGNNHTNSNSTANNRSTRNGHARGTVPVSPPGILDIPATNVEIKWSQTQGIQNNIKANTTSGTIDIDHSPTPSPSPTKPKVIDLTIVTSDTSKSKPCLLSWKACRECTFSDDQSSNEGSDGNVSGTVMSEHLDVNACIPMSTYQSTSFTACSTAQS